MTVTINLPYLTEMQIRSEAQRMGLSTQALILSALAERFAQSGAPMSSTFAGNVTFSDDHLCPENFYGDTI